MNNQHRICKNCNIEHVENCNTCFGYGLKCPECGEISTLF